MHQHWKPSHFSFLFCSQATLDWEPEIRSQTHTRNLMSGYKFCTFPRKFEVPDHGSPLSCPIPTKDTHGEGLLYPWVSSSGNRLSCARLEGHCHASFLPSVHFPPQAPAPAAAPQPIPATTNMWQEVLQSHIPSFPRWKLKASELSYT